MTTAPPEGIPGEIPYLKLPRPAEVFERRSRRFREVAPGHPIEDFLEALADLAAAQARALSRVNGCPRNRALSAEVPLLATSWRRDADWRDALAGLVADVSRRPWPGPAASALARLGAASPAELEALADGIIAGTASPDDLAVAPFTAAALQVYFTALAADLPGGLVERVPSGCPVCGSPPVAGVVMGDDKLRYLTCSLCSSEWNLTRLQCWRCRSTGGISYLAIAGEDGVKAEACASCGAYVKLFYREQMPAAEPLADDVASLTLDLLAAQEGWARSGVNLFLLGGGEG